MTFSEPLSPSLFMGEGFGVGVGKLSISTESNESPLPFLIIFLDLLLCLCGEFMAIALPQAPARRQEPGDGS